MRPAKKPLKSLFSEPKVRTIVLTRTPSRFEHKFALLSEDPSFQLDISILRDKVGIDLDNPRLYEIDKRDIKVLLKRHNLASEWEYLVSQYLTTGEFQGLGDPHGPEIEIRQNKNYALIKVFPETTNTEVQDAYKRLRAEWMPNRNKAVLVKNFDRDAYIYGLHKSKKTYKQIGTLVEEKFKEKLDQWHLSRIVDKMKKRREKL